MIRYFLYQLYKDLAYHFHPQKLRKYLQYTQDHYEEQGQLLPLCFRKKKALLISFMLGGALIGAAGVLQASYSYGASTMSTTLDFLLQALAASLLGTTFSRTEELSVIGTAISALFISSLSSALIANGVSNLLQPGLLGLILVVSVMLTVIKKREIGQVTIF